MPTYSNLPPHLELLQISDNNLTGSIPKNISNITKLSKLGIMNVVTGIRKNHNHSTGFGDS